MIGKIARAQQPRVVIDGRLRRADATGVASYARAVEEGLSAIGRAPELLEDAAAGRLGGPAGPVARALRWTRAQAPWSLGLRDTPAGLFSDDIFRRAHVRFATTGRLLRLRATGPGGIMHWTYPIPARIDGWVNLYTIHDVIPLRTPTLSPIDAIALRRRLECVARSAERIVAVSEWARTSIAETLNLDARGIVNCGNAVTAMTPGDGDLPHGLVRGSYFLFCGLIEPRKNLSRIIAGWTASGTTLPLVICGPDAPVTPLPPGTVVLPYRSRAQLIDLMRFSRALVFPSLAEGFGLPVAEAMTLGVPVLTSGRDALAETAGGAALCVDPFDTAAIAAGIAALDQNAELRADLVSRGYRRAAAFTSAALGTRLAALYDAVRDEFAGASSLGA